jgi:hypothetical protein
MSKATDNPAGKTYPPFIKKYNDNEPINIFVLNFFRPTNFCVFCDGSHHSRDTRVHSKSLFDTTVEVL